MRFLTTVLLFSFVFCRSVLAQAPDAAKTDSNSLISVDGKTYKTLAQAFTACPRAGCVIDMRGNGNSAALVLGSFDPGEIPVTILLGPFNYTLTQMTLRSALHLVGLGGATQIHQGNPSVAPFVLPTTNQQYPASVASGVLLDSFGLQGAPGSTSDAIDFICYPASVPTVVNGVAQPLIASGGLWYSHIRNISISGAPFGGEGIRLDSTKNPATASPGCINQFLAFENITAFRAVNGPPVLHITGAMNGQIHFYGHNEMDSPGDNNGLVNIQVDDPVPSPSNFCPYSIQFDNLTSQGAQGPSGVAILLKGVVGFVVNTGHFESDNGILKAVKGLHCGNSGVVLQGSIIAAGSGIDKGHGFILDTDDESSVAFLNNAIFGTPDIFNAGSSRFVMSIGNQATTPSGPSSSYSVPAPNQIPYLKILDQGQCTMSRGSCPVQPLASHIYQNAPQCFANWTGAGKLAGTLMVPSTTKSVTPESNVSTDTAQVNWACFGY